VCWAAHVFQAGKTTLLWLACLCQSPHTTPHCNPTMPHTHTSTHTLSCLLLFVQFWINVSFWFSPGCGSQFQQLGMGSSISCQLPFLYHLDSVGSFLPRMPCLVRFLQPPPPACLGFCNSWQPLPATAFLSHSSGAC